MKYWSIGAVAILVLVWHLVVLARLGDRNRELESAMALGHRQMETIERQTDAMQEQSQALNECTMALRSADRRHTKSSSRLRG